MTDSELNEKLNNDFRAFRIEHDSRIAQKYVEQIPGKGLSEENFTPQEKNKLASLTGGADIDTSQFATKTELQTALDNATVDTSPFATKTELQTAINNVAIDTSPFATKTELQTAISNVAIDSLSSNDVYIPADTYNTIMSRYNNVAWQSVDVNLTEFLTLWAKRLTPKTMGEYTAEGIRNAAYIIVQPRRVLISDDLYVPQEDMRDYLLSVSETEEWLQYMQSAIPSTFITTAPYGAFGSDIIYTEKAIAISLDDEFLRYLKANDIVPTTMYLNINGSTYKITDDNVAWFNVIVHGSFEKLTESNLANSGFLYACCQLQVIFDNLDSYYSPDIQIENDTVGLVMFAVV